MTVPKPEYRLLTADELAAGLDQLDDWSVVDGKLHKEFRFGDFAEAFGFMAAAAIIAERLNHHPEWFNVYATVRVDLTTHDVGGLSPYDLALAARMDELAS